MTSRRDLRVDSRRLLTAVWKSVLDVLTGDDLNRPLIYVENICPATVQFFFGRAQFFEEDDVRLLTSVFEH